MKKKLYNTLKLLQCKSLATNFSFGVVALLLCYQWCPTSQCSVVILSLRYTKAEKVPHTRPQSLPSISLQIQQSLFILSVEAMQFELKESLNKQQK
jgi:hypothetical protein